MIDYRALVALSAIVEHKGFERAAQILHISQSAISQRIKQLESRLGQPVLLRQTPPSPTQLGQKLIGHLQRVQHLEADLGLNQEEHSRVRARIAVNADSLSTWFGEAIGRMTSEMDIDLVIADQDVGVTLMRRGEVLASLCSDNNLVNGARIDRLGVMRYRAYASPDFLLQQKLLENFSNLHAAPCLIFNQDDTLQHRFLAMLNQSPPTCPISCPSTEGFIQLAINGCGFGMLPEVQAALGVQNGSLVDLSPEHFIDVPLYWHSWRSSSSVMKKLRASVIKTAHRWLRQDK